MQSMLSLGVDVAKAEVVVACSCNSFPVRAIPNQAPALRAFLETLPAGTRLALEATGSYHVLLADLAVAMGMMVYVLNPKDMRHYARAVGMRGKTDQVDAAVIARYVEREHARLHPYRPPLPQQRELDQLLKRRARIVALKNALRLSLADLPALRLPARATGDQFDALLQAMDDEIARLCQTLPGYREQAARLRSIVGIGPLTSTWLTNLLNRVPLRNGDALIAFLGLDPRPWDSGQKRGRRRLSKRGPAEGRRLLFNAAMAAAKTQTWQPLYARYRQQGWSSTAALIIIARKLARIAFAVFKTQTPFDPAKLSMKT